MEFIISSSINTLQEQVTQIPIVIFAAILSPLSQSTPVPSLKVPYVQST